MQDLPGEVQVVSDPIAAAAMAAEEILGASARANSEHGFFSIALCGGSAPKPLYEALATSVYRNRIPWPTWKIFWGDERAVPLDNDESNYRLAQDTFLAKVPVDQEQIFPMPAYKADLSSAAMEYAQQLERELPPTSTGVPRFDCILLGLGENGHTASLFPHDPVLGVTDRWVAPSTADYSPRQRLTFTYPLINSSAEVIFIVTGNKKGDALRQTVQGTAPASGVHPDNGKLLWILDREAGESMRAATSASTSYRQP